MFQTRIVWQEKKAYSSFTKEKCSFFHLVVVLTSTFCTTDFVKPEVFMQIFNSTSLYVRYFVVKKSFAKTVVLFLTYITFLFCVVLLPVRPIRMNIKPLKQGSKARYIFTRMIGWSLQNDFMTIIVAVWYRQQAPKIS